MKRITATLLALIMILCLAGCTPSGGKSSEELYKAFLAGTEKIQGAMPKAWEDYDMETETYSPYLENGESLTIADLIRKTNKFYELYGPDACVESVEYAIIDCGNDGEPELAVLIKYPDESLGGWNTFVIKNIDGKLKLCYHAQSYYRYTEDLLNKYGMFESSGSSGAGSMVYGQGFVDASGQYQFIYDTEYFWQMSWCWALQEKLAEAANKLETEIPENAAVTLTTLKPYSEFEGDEYYDPSSYLISLEAEFKEDLDAAMEITKEAGIAIMEQNEIDKIVENRKLELGITEEMSADHDYVEWTPVDNDAIHDICAYGTDPVFCSTVGDFIEAIHDDTVIVLAPGEYDLSAWIAENGPKGVISKWIYSEGNNNQPGAYSTSSFYELEECALIINRINNMKIVAEDPQNLPHILSQPVYEDVIDFQDCYNITIDGAIIGHAPDKGSCSGAVINYTGCSTMKLKNCDLYGCGTYGVTGFDNHGINVIDSVIHDCTYGCSELVNGSSTQFVNTVFENCTGFTMFNIYSNYSVVFDGCTFKNLGTDMLYVDEDSTVYFYANNVFDADALTGCQNQKGTGDVYFY